MPAANPQNTDAPNLLAISHLQRGNALQTTKQYAEAVAYYEKAIALKPDYADAYNNRGVALHALKRYGDALASYDQAIALNPDYAGVYDNRGNTLRALNRHEEALASYDKAIALDPNHAKAVYNRGLTLQLMKRHDEALASYEKAIALKPDYAETYNNRANILQERQQYEDALANYDKAIALKPSYAEAYSNRGNILLALRRYDEALVSYEKAVALNPGNAIAYNNLGILFRELRRYEEALASYDKAIAGKPDYAEAYNNRGFILQEMNRPAQALASYDKAIAINPNLPESHDNRGNVLQEMYRYDEALASYAKAIAINPDFASAYNNRGNVLRGLQRYDEALANYAKAVSLNPDIPSLMGAYLHTKMHLCDWQGIDTIFKTLAEKIAAGKPATAPFTVTTTPLSLAQQKTCAQIYVQDKFPPRATPLWNGERYAHDKIRIGYFSADFYNHATAYLAAGLFELHDRSKFEIVGFSFGAPSMDAIRKRLEKAFDRFIDVRTKSDLEIARLARQMEIDIAVDLKGFTHGSRTGIFALRPAPVQVNYLGYPGTMGVGYMDYLIADPIVIPAEHRQYYTEKIAYLPDSYQVNDSRRKIADKRFSRRELGLPEEDFVFCCFNNSYKITPDVFDIWMRVLHEVPGSVLWLIEGAPTLASNLRKEANSRGIAGERLVFAGWMDLPDHLARCRLADLFLDTFHYNAHTTASDALWAGVPVLTCLGETFAARVAASLLSAAHLPELITRSRQEYETRALELATHPEKLSAIRRKLADNRTTCPLFDTARFTKHIENAYAQMWEKSQAGSQPDDIYAQ